MAELTVAELSAKLAEQPQKTVIRIVRQPSFPLQEVIVGVVSSDDLQDDGADTSTPAAPVVYVVVGGHPPNASPYGPPDAWAAVSRKRF